jgi:predicted dehydrogenase
MKDKTQPSQASKASRRGFIKKGALAAAAMMTSPGLLKTPVYGQRQAPALGSVLGANDRIVCGFIGVGGQGYNSHLRNIVNKNDSGGSLHEYELNATGAAACDVNAVRRDRAKATLGVTDADVYEDYRQLLDRDDIDAVFIGTVDHWHKQIAIDAMEAGKHVYCEKPMTRYLGESFDIYDTVMKTGKTFQIGSQYCTEGKWHKASELIQAGKIGPLVLAQDSYMRNNPDGEWNYEIEPTTTPENVNWDMWLGPVSDRPFSADENHRIHPLLIATGSPEFPKRVACLGTRKITTDRDVPDNTQLLAEMPSGLTIMITGSTVNEQGLGQVIRGHEATLYFGGNTLELRPERPFADLVDQEMYENIQPGVSIPAHIQDYLDSIRNNRQPNGNIDVAIKTQTIISLAEMSERLGEMLYFDPETRKITNGSGKEFEPITYGTLEMS